MLIYWLLSFLSECFSLNLHVLNSQKHKQTTLIVITYFCTTSAWQSYCCAQYCLF